MDAEKDGRLAEQLKAILEKWQLMEITDETLEILYNDIEEIIKEEENK